jgi:hypothetical protein
VSNVTRAQRKRIPVEVTLHPLVLEALDKWAEREELPRSRAVEFVLSAYLAKRGLLDVEAL